MLHVVVTMVLDPTALDSTSGFSALQAWQKLKSSKSWDRNAMYLGSVRKFPSTCNNLAQAKVQHCEQKLCYLIFFQNSGNYSGSMEEFTFNLLLKQYFKPLQCKMLYSARK